LVKIACFVPVRSGSKRIKNKNIISFKKTNLLNFVFNKISKSKKINEFILASDSYKFFNKIKNINNKITYFKRSKKTSRDNSSTESVILEYLNSTKNHPDIIILLQITNPFVESQHLDGAIKMLLSKKKDCVFSAVQMSSFMWKNKINSEPINYNYKKRPRSQKFKKFFIENGSFYIFYTKKFIKFKNRLHKKIAIYEMPKTSLHEIDDHQDLKIVKKLI
jgi:CMP-N-acetylneuraminic acid synthetase